MHYEIRSQDASSSDPPTKGSTVTRRLPKKDRVPAQGERAGRGNSAHRCGPGTRGGEGTAISLSPRQPRSLPRCACARAVARHPRPTRNRSGMPPVTHCAMARTRRRAGAATPTRRNTTQALDRARRASDVINTGNYTGNDNPRRPRPPAVALVRERAGSRVRDALVFVMGVDWLAYLLRRWGDRWFAMNDTEAYWRGWQITKTHAGLGRRYRDIRYDTLAACAQCAGAGVSGWSRGPGASLPRTGS